MKTSAAFDGISKSAETGKTKERFLISPDRRSTIQQFETGKQALGSELRLEVIDFVSPFRTL